MKDRKIDISQKDGSESISEPQKRIDKRLALKIGVKAVSVIGGMCAGALVGGILKDLAPERGNKVLTRFLWKATCVIGSNLISGLVSSKIEDHILESLGYDELEGCSDGLDEDSDGDGRVNINDFHIC